ELFEETGLMLARRRDGRGLPEARRQALARRFQGDLESGRLGLGALLAAADLWLDVRALVPFAHWITPEGYAKRYDTRFFITRAPRGQEARHDGRELVHSLWLRPCDALAAGARKRYRLMFPTRMNLRRLAEAASVSQALAQARQRPQVAVLPQRVIEDGVCKARVPRAAGYGAVPFRHD
ncbi:MAG: NUDIX hydrolase, partial [Alphaproteobacteria bacterium]